MGLASRVSGLGLNSRLKTRDSEQKTISLGTSRLCGENCFGYGFAALRSSSRGNPVARAKGFNIESGQMKQESMLLREDSHGAIFTQTNLRS